MIDSFSIGDFVSLKNHPYLYDNDFAKIAANADMTPPVMIISEILNKDEYNITNGKNLEKQFKCIYFSHKDGKYHENWLKENHVKKLSKIKTYLDSKTLKNIDTYELNYLKEIYSGQQVCLTNVDFELNKKKVFIENSDGKKIHREKNHLDFLPPVMIIIDIIKNKEEKRYSNKTKNFLEKDCSKYLFKCKWYNNNSSSYSEDLFPSHILGLVKSQNDLIDTVSIPLKGSYSLILKLKKKIKLETSSSQLDSYIVKPIELVFKHYYYKLSYFDQFKRENSSISLDDLVYEKNDYLNSIYYIHNKLIFEEKYPRYGTTLKHITETIFNVNDYFLITYVDKLNRITKRIIKVSGKDVYSEKNIINEEDKEKEYFFIIANCLLRNGCIRHFNLEQIKEAIKIPNGSKLFE